MELIEYFYVPADKIGLVLSYMNPCGWRFDNITPGEGDPIEKWYGQATSRDWDGHQPIFCLKEYNHSKKFFITSDLLMRANNQVATIRPFEDLKRKLGIQ